MILKRLVFVLSLKRGFLEVSCKEDPLEDLYVILINIHDYKCLKKKKKTRKIFFSGIR